MGAWLWLFIYSKKCMICLYVWGVWYCLDFVICLVDSEVRWQKETWKRVLLDRIDWNESSYTTKDVQSHLWSLHTATQHNTTQRKTTVPYLCLPCIESSNKINYVQCYCKSSDIYVDSWQSRAIKSNEIKSIVEPQSISSILSVLLLEEIYRRRNIELNR